MSYNNCELIIKISPTVGITGSYASEDRGSSASAGGGQRKRKPSVLRQW
ncbi:MAG: hypothetical protein ACFFD2_00825 [Promethearchaeota archaeon]